MVKKIKLIDFKDLLTVDYAPGMDPLIKRNAKKRKQDVETGSNAEYSSTYAPNERISTIENYGTQTQRLMSPLQKVRQDKEKDDRDRYGKIKAGVLPRSNKKISTETSEAVAPGGKAPKPVSGTAAQAYIDGGKHAANVSMGREGKHNVIKSPNSKKHIHVFTYEEFEELMDQFLDEAVLTPQQRRLKAMQFKRMRAKIELGQKRSKTRFADPKRLLNRAKVAARKAVFNKLTKGMTKDELSFQRRQEIEKRMDTPGMKIRIQRLAIKMIPKERQAEIQRHAQAAASNK
jgi:hypothetical protein